MKNFDLNAAGALTPDWSLTALTSVVLILLLNLRLFSGCYPDELPDCFVVASAVVFVFLKSTCQLSDEFLGQWTNKSVTVPTSSSHPASTWPVMVQLYQHYRLPGQALATNQRTKQDRWEIKGVSLSPPFIVFTCKQRTKCWVSTSPLLPLLMCENRSDLRPDPDLNKENHLNRETSLPQTG